MIDQKLIIPVPGGTDIFARKDVINNFQPENSTHAHVVSTDTGDPVMVVDTVNGQVIFSSGSVARPGIAFTGGTDGLRQPSLGAIDLIIASSARFRITSASIGAIGSGGAQIKNSGASATQPTLLIDVADTGTGLGKVAGLNGMISFISKNIEVMRINDITGYKSIGIACDGDASAKVSILDAANPQIKTIATPGIENNHRTMPDGLFKNISTSGAERIFGKVELIDNGYYDLPSGAYGWGRLFLGNMEEWADFQFTSDGTVTLITVSSGVVVNTDTPASVCVFDNGTNVRIKNRLGALRQFNLDIQLST